MTVSEIIIDISKCYKKLKSVLNEYSEEDQKKIKLIGKVNTLIIYQKFKYLNLKDVKCDHLFYNLQKGDILVNHILPDSLIGLWFNYDFAYDYYKDILPSNDRRILYNNISILPKLPENLKYLDISNQSDIEFDVKDLINLTTFVADNCKLETIPEFSDNMNYLYLNNNYISGNIKLPKNILCCDINNNYIENISNLSKLKELKILNISNNLIKSITIPENLYDLSILSNPIEILSFKDCNVEELSIICDCELNEFYPKINMKIKHDFDVAEIQIKIKGYNKIINDNESYLEYIQYILDNSIKGNIKNEKEIEYIHIRDIYKYKNKNVDNIKFIGYIEYLKWEKINPNSDITFSSIKKLNMSSCGLIELPKLPEYVENLDCSDNRIREISDLPHTIKILDCSKNLLTDILPIPLNLNYINLSDNMLEINVSKDILDAYDIEYKI